MKFNLQDEVGHLLISPGMTADRVTFAKSAEVGQSCVCYEEARAQLATRSRNVSGWPTFPGKTTYARVCQYILLEDRSTYGYQQISTSFRGTSKVVLQRLPALQSLLYAFPGSFQPHLRK